MVKIEIKIHKKLNREPLKFEKELNLKMYKEIVLKINKSNSLEKEYLFTHQEIRKNLGIRKKEELKDFQKYFHSEGIGERKDIFILDEKFSVGGGVFSSKVDIEKGTIGFMINPYWKKYFYSRLDIDQWHQVKGNQKEIKALELGEEQEEKLLNMMGTILNHSIKGKYSQRLADLLYQFKDTGFFVGNWEEFKKVLEINPKYRASDIDKWVLNPAKVELKKVGIKITKIDKVKKGRSIDKIKIFFKMESLKNKESEILEGEIVEDRGAIDKAILKAKRNIFVSKAWNKRVDTKIIKLLKDKGEDFTIKLLNELYINLKQEVKTTLVQYINGILTNIKLEQEEQEVKANKQVKSKSIQGVIPKTEDVKEVIEEIREPKKETLEEYKERVTGLAKEQIGKIRGGYIGDIIGPKETFEEVEQVVREFSINLKLEI